MNPKTNALFPSIGPIQPLFRLNAANLNVTTDQAITKIATFTTALVTAAYFCKRSGTFSVAAGGIYPQAAKAGTALVAAATTYTNLTTNGTWINYPLTTQGAIEATLTYYLSLTTANGSAMTADVIIFGYVLT